MRNLPDDWDGVTGDIQQIEPVGICPRCGGGIIGEAEHLNGKPYHHDCYFEEIQEEDE